MGAYHQCYVYKRNFPQLEPLPVLDGGRSEGGIHLESGSVKNHVRLMPSARMGNRVTSARGSVA
jgi:hypothetical protein